MRRGTTPTIRLLTSEDLSSWDRVIVTLKGSKSQLDFEKDRLGFENSNNNELPYSVYFVLTQEETFSLDKSFKVQIRFVKGEGDEEVAGATEIGVLTLDPVLKDGVIHVDQTNG